VTAQEKSIERLINQAARREADDSRSARSRPGDKGLIERRYDMKIGLDVTQAVKREGRGIARYIRCVSPYLANDIPGLEATLCIRGARWRNRSMVTGMALATQRSWLPFTPVMSTRGLDLFHSFGNHLPAWSDVPCTFTIHDFRALDLSVSKNKRRTRLHRNIERADGIICLTEHGRSRLMKHYPELDVACVDVITHGVDHTVFHPRDTAMVARKAASMGLKQPFLLQLGSWFPHKNLELSIRAFARSRVFAEGFHLVFVGGGAGRPHLESLKQLAGAEGVEDRITWIDHADNLDLPFLLNATSCLLQPSRYEGFALPLFEAMASGVPGVVSDSSCLPEVAGGVWPVGNQDDPDGFAAGIDAMSLDEIARTIAIRAGRERAAEFTWAKTAVKMADFFSRVLEKRK